MLSQAQRTSLRRAHLGNRVVPGLKIVRADVDGVHSAELLGRQAAHAHAQLQVWRQGDEVAQAAVIVPPPTKLSDNGVVKPPVHMQPS